MRRLLLYVDRLVEAAVALIFVVMLCVGFVQVFNRFFLNKSLSWSEELQVFGHIWLVFLAIPIAYRRAGHFQVEALRAMLTGRAAVAFDIFIELLWAALAISLIYLTLRVARVAALQESPGLEVPMSYPYYGMVVGGAYLALAIARQNFDRFFASGKGAEQ